MTDSDTRGLEDSPTDSRSRTVSSIDHPVHPGLLDGRERDLLAILARHAHDYPITVEQATSALADYHDDTSRGRVLGDLDTLETEGLVVEHPGGWGITGPGRDVLEHHVEWQADALGLTTLDADHRQAGAKPPHAAEDEQSLGAEMADTTDRASLHDGGEE